MLCRQMALSGTGTGTERNITDLVFQDLTINGKKAFVLPHPSPLNMKWFRDYPEFLEKRIYEIEKAVHETLGIS